MDSYLLGIDVGTGSVKVAIVDRTAAIVGCESEEYTILHEHDNWAQIETVGLWSCLVSCLKKLKELHTIDLSRIASIGISCLCPGLTAFDREGRILIDPIIYTDRRSMAEADWINQTVGEKTLFDISGNNVMAGAISCTSMLWIKNHKPEIYKQTQYFGHVNSMIGLMLTGEVAIDYSNASYTGLFETGQTKKWSKVLCEKIGLDIEKMPPLKSSTEVIGRLKAKMFLEFGIPEGTPVVIGGADTACAAITCGVTRHGDAFESAGTTNVITICTDKPKFDRGFINRCHVIDGLWIYQGAMSNTGASLRWVRDELCKDLKNKAYESEVDPYVLINDEAANSRAGAGGIVFLPYMAGERCPIWDPYAKGMFFGVTLESTRGDMIRAVMEGCGYGLRQLYELAEGITETEYRSFISVGGGARSEIWSQIKADITGKEILILKISEAAVLGAALLAGVGIGIYEDIQAAADCIERNFSKKIQPDKKNKIIYDQRFKTYLALYPRVKDLYRD